VTRTLIAFFEYVLHITRKVLEEKLHDGILKCILFLYYENVSGIMLNKVLFRAKTELSDANHDLGK